MAGVPALTLAATQPMEALMVHLCLTMLAYMWMAQCGHQAENHGYHFIEVRASQLSWSWEKGSSLIQTLKTGLKPCRHFDQMLWSSSGAPGCLSEGGTEEVSAYRACMGEPSPDQVGGDHSGWSGHDRLGAVAEGGNPHPVAQPPLNRGGGLELPGCWMATLGAGKQRRPIASGWRAPTLLLVTANDATHGYKWQVLTLASYFRPEEDHSIWSKRCSNPVFKNGIRELPLYHLIVIWGPVRTLGGLACS